MSSPGRQVNVYGVADCFVTLTPSNNSSYSELGTTRDGVSLTSDGYFIDVHNDENGGEAGPPIEIQFVGETAKIRIELTKYDPTVAANLEDHCYSGSAGVVAPAGTLMFASSTIQVGNNNYGAIGIKISCLTPAPSAGGSAGGAGSVVRTYRRCVLHDAVEVNRGTKFCTMVITATAYKDAGGALWVEGTS